MFLSYPRAEVCLVTVVRSDVDGGRVSVFSSVWERQRSLREKLPPCQRSSSCLVFSSTQESIFFCQHLALKRGKWLSAASFFTSQWWDQYEKCGATQKVWTRLSRSVRSYLSELVSLEIVVDLYLISAAGYGLAPIFTVSTYLFVVQSWFLSPTKLNLFTNVKNQLEKGGTDLRGMCSGLSKKKSAVANVSFISWLDTNLCELDLKQVTCWWMLFMFFLQKQTRLADR